ncbi:persephin [Ictalurus furcatus]|uniref:persephin n=1 Tax=Ictalurus furcatus TaxID=66913 RepID=UPI0023501039|nr:persephin [Ictalurus furcatus]
MTLPRGGRPPKVSDKCQTSKNKAVPRNRASQMRQGEKEEKKTERRGRARGDAGEEACCVHAAAQRTRVDCIRFCCRFGTSHVRDLGLGYDSDEMVLFKYCSGACPRVPSNHELTLTNLRLSGALPPTETWHYTPCCRPTRHEDMAFLDNAHRWHKVEKLSAAACYCVG